MLDKLRKFDNSDGGRILQQYAEEYGDFCGWTIYLPRDFAEQEQPVYYLEKIGVNNQVYVGRHLIFTITPAGIPSIFTEIKAQINKLNELEASINELFGENYLFIPEQTNC